MFSRVRTSATKTAPDANTTGLPEHVPAHVAIVMDGNGRWATQRHLPRVAGHREGAENIRRLLETCVEYGVKYLTLYAFSTENWERPEEEIRGLLTILGEFIERETPKLHAEGVQLRHMGRLDRLPSHLAQAVRRAIDLTRNNERLILIICFDYGSRSEILDAVPKIVTLKVPSEQIDEELISHYLYSGDTPDPDLIIRTAGEQRLSNFLLWQAAYSEYWFSPCFWPSFGKDEFCRALVDYSNRLRKFGKTPEQIATLKK